MPSLARQTGQACTACHIGGFGPQLTPYGRQFKMDGYTDARERDAGELWVPPVSAMVMSSFTHTDKGQPGGAGKYFGNNDNAAVDQVSLFWAGAIYGPVGAFIQATYDGVERHTSWDNADIRAAHHFTVGDTDLLVGATLNNNPTVQDPWNTTPAWGFPYTGSALAPGPSAAPLIDGGLEQTVVGATVYSLIDSHYYLEFGGYRSLNHATLEDLGTEPHGLSTIDGLAPYARLAIQDSFDLQYMSLGAFGMYAALRPGGDHHINTDKYTDVGLDATYQFLGTGKHVATVNTVLMQEWQQLDGTYASGGSQYRNNRLTSFKINASYYYNQSIGATLGYFNLWGTRDSGLYAPDPIDGSRNGKPNSSGIVAQVDWTPFGKDDSFAAPWVNLRLGLQYTAYLKFNGSSHNYDGSGRSASDNNTIFAFAWMAF